MKHIILFSSILLLGGFASAAGLPTDSLSTDTTAVQLDEVVVQGRTQKVVKYGVEYTPGKDIKRHSQSATKLLDAMQIPQLSVDPLAQTVKTLSGKDVSMFIDYVPATDKDLQGMRVEDVLRVEVLEYPQDPRFQSAQHVVNFIMHKYEWGGYTKLGARGWFLNPNAAGAADVYSKFVRKRWTFDATLGGYVSYSDQNGGHRAELYRDIDFHGQHYSELGRYTDIDDYYNHNNDQWTSLRASYSSDSVYIQHTVGFSRSAVPGEMTRSTLSFSDPVLGDGLTSVSRSNNQELTPWIQAYYWFQLPHGNSITAFWNFMHTWRKRHSSYLAGNLDHILNANRERTYSPNAQLYYSKNFGHGNTFRTALMTYNTIYHTDYYGSYQGRQSLLSSENMLFLEYMQNWGFGLNLYSRVGMSYVIGRINGHTNQKQWNPRLGVQVQYKFNDRHNASIEGWWGNNHPQASTSNTAIVQSNELLWLQGNPGLRNTIFKQATASYNFIPNNQYSFSASAEYEGSGHKQAYEYFVVPGYDGVVRRTVNSGNGHRYSGYVSASGNFFDGKLRLKLTGEANRIVLTGIDAQRCNWLMGQIRATYYVGNFEISGRYMTPQKQLSAWSGGTVTRYPSIYEFAVSYNVGSLKLTADITQAFNHGTRKREQYVGSPHYAERSWWSGQFDRGVFLSASYTFSYGKKVRMGNELGRGSSGGSAILQ